MGTHSQKSPSKAERFGACPGSIHLAAAVPAELVPGASPAALLGTAAHGLVERCLSTGTEPEDYLGRIIEIINDGVTFLKVGAKIPKDPDRVWFEVDEDMTENVRVATGYVRRRCVELGIAESQLKLETRTNPLPDRDDTSGTADVIIDGWPGLLEVFDYKNGYILVEHQDNPQLLAYLLGVALEYGMSHERYAITVCQPNSDHPEGAIRTFTATADELMAFQAKHRAAVELCDEASDAAVFGVDRDWEVKYLHAGEHCRFCEAAPTCPARRELAQSQAGIDFAGEPVELVDFINGSLARAADIARWAPQLDALIRAAEQMVQRGLEAGYDVPDFKLVRMRSNRKWRDDLTPEQLVEKLIADGLIEDASTLYTVPELLSGPQVEKLIKGKGAGKKREQLNESFLVKPEGRLTLARDTDKRTAVESGPDPMFLETPE